MKKYRILILIGAILSLFLTMDRIFSSRMYFHNMYDNHLVYDINIYVQLFSVVLFIGLLVLIIYHKLTPTYLIVTGILMTLTNTIAVLLYITTAQDFYFSIYIVQGIILTLIGLSLQSTNFTMVKRLSVYFFLEFLLILIAVLSEDSILYMHKTFEANLLGAFLTFVLGILIPISMYQYVLDDKVEKQEFHSKPFRIDQLIMIGSLVSIGVLSILIIMNLPNLLGIIIDADMRTIFYYRMSAVLRIGLYLILLYGFVSIIRKSEQQWVVPTIIVTIFVATIFPFTADIEFYLQRIDHYYGLILDLIILLLFTISFLFKKWKLSFILSLWFTLNVLLAPLPLGNIQQFLVFRHISYINWLNFMIQTLYYSIPMTISLTLYNKISTEEEI